MKKLGVVIIRGRIYFMKKLTGVVSVLLVLSMLFIALSSCKEPEQTNETNGGETQMSTPKNNSELLDQYVIIYPSSLGEEGKEKATDLRAMLRTQLGINLKVGSDTAPQNQYEILIGNTNRPQSASAKLAENTFGYTVGIYDSHIAINASNDYFMHMAMDVFVNHVGNENSLEQLKTPTVFNANVYSIKANEKSGYGVVYNNCYEKSVSTLLTQLSDEKSVTFPNTSKLKPGVMEYEILIGDTDRPESESVLEKIGYNEATVAVVNKKIVVRGWSEFATLKAIEKFETFLDEFWSEEANAYLIPETLDRSVFSVEDEWNVGVPVYSDGKVVSANHVGQDNRLVCIENTTKDAYLSYRAELAENGFTLYTENELGGNLFATYTSADTMLHTYYTAYNNTVRIVSAPMGKTNLPPDVTKPEVVKTHDSSITQMILNYYDKTYRNDGNFGNCYVMVLDDGSLMIWDGGGSYSDGDVTRLWNLIQELGTKGADGKIKIAAWFITHEHGDHFWGTYKVLTEYASQIDLETVYCNVIADEMRPLEDAGGFWVEGSSMKQIQEAHGNRIKIVRVHTGQKFWVRNAQIEILYTPEDLYPHDIKDFNDFNDSSIISRITVDGTTFLMQGDADKIASTIACSMYGESLKSDVCQIAHHGYGRTPEMFYHYADADLYMFPFSEKIFNLLLNGTSPMILKYGTVITSNMKFIVEQVGNENVLRADHYNKTFVFKTKEIIVRTTNNDQPGYPYGDKSTNGYR